MIEFGDDLFFERREIIQAVNVAGIDSVLNQLEVYVWLDGVVSCFEVAGNEKCFTDSLFNQLRLSFDEYLEKNVADTITRHDYHVLLMGAFLPDNDFYVKGFFKLDFLYIEIKGKNFWVPFFSSQSSTKVNGKINNQFIFSLYNPEQGFSAVDKLVDAEFNDDFFEYFTGVNDGLNVYYPNTKLKAIFKEYGIDATALDVPSNNKPSAKDKEQQGKINSQTFFNHGAFVYALAKSNPDLLKGNGEINKSAVCDFVMKELESTDFSRSKQALERCLKKLLDDFEFNSGITAKKNAEKQR